MKYSIFLFLTITLASLSSCDPESANDLSDNYTYSTLQISNSPNTQHQLYCSSNWTSLQVEGDLFFESNTVNTQVPSGSVFPYMIMLNGGYAEGCADIELKTYNNGSLVDTQNFQMGLTEVSPPTYCDNTVAGQFGITLSIESD